MTLLEFISQKLNRILTLPEITQEDLNEAVELQEKKYILELGKVIMVSAPKSMNPQKINMHFNTLISYFKRDIVRKHIDENIVNAVLRECFPDKNNIGVVHNVNEYSQKVNTIIIQALKTIK